MIGIDIVKINRLNKKKKSFLQKIFSEKELKETNKINFYEKLAGKWAAKEAAYKAGFHFANHEIEILTEKQKPSIYVNGKIQNAMVSISHEKEYAVAVVFKV